jgi:hypothetical protein
MDHLTHNIEFRTPTTDDIEQMRNNFNNCEWIDDWIDDIENNIVNTLRVLVSNEIIIGIAHFYHSGFIANNIPLYYVSTRCTIDKQAEGIRIQTISTPGRLLWAYILHEIYILNGQDSSRRFIVYNHAIPSAIGYHKKMGMFPANELSLIQPSRNPNKKYEIIKLEKYIIKSFMDNPELNTAELSNIRSDEFNETYLFYVSSSRINYNSINSILESLPKSTKRTSEETTYESRQDNEENQPGKIGRIGGKYKKRRSKKYYKSKINKKNKTSRINKIKKTSRINKKNKTSRINKKNKTNKTNKKYYKKRKTSKNNFSNI